MDDGTDPRGRPVVWATGALPSASGGRRRRVWLGRLGLVAGSLAALAALVGGTAAWSVLTPVGSTPDTPLWIAPPAAARHDGSADRTRVASTSSPTPTSTSASATLSVDHHGGLRAPDRAGRDAELFGRDDHGRRGRSGSAGSASTESSPRSEHSAPRSNGSGSDRHRGTDGRVTRRGASDDGSGRSGGGSSGGSSGRSTRASGSGGGSERTAGAGHPSNGRDHSGGADHSGEHSGGGDHSGGGGD